jgi:CRP/FNR family transcriptional regulator, cyclic AMP receptor protein
MPDAMPFDFATLERLGAPLKHFEAGEKVFLADDSAAVMYVVRSGRIDVITYGTVLENVRAGGMVGEMALIDGTERSAAAIAAEPTQAIAIDKAMFDALIRDDPGFALSVMRLLTARIRRMNDQV